MNASTSRGGREARDSGLVDEVGSTGGGGTRAGRGSGEVAEVAGSVRGGADGWGGVGARGGAGTLGRDPGELTFSQAHGYEKLPGLLALGELPEEARTRIWNVLYKDIMLVRKSIVHYPLHFRDVSPWPEILLDVHSNHFVRAADALPKIKTTYREDAKYIHRELKSLPFNKCFDLIEFILRHPKCPESLTGAMKKAFADANLAYTIHEGPPATIVPAVTREEGMAIVQSMEALREGGMEGAGEHLREASECINRGDWRNGVKESISAVESVARGLASTKASSLSDALKSLESGQPLHGALREGLKRLYGYTSDEKGIRHALLEEANSDVGRDEAVFMFGACASFASYLWRKYGSGLPQLAAGR